MDFAITDAQRALRDQARAIATSSLRPTAAQRERAHAIDPTVVRDLAAAGLMGVNIPRSLGGMEAGAVAYALAIREIAGGDAAVAVTTAVTNMVAETITRFGTPAQRQMYVPRLVSGEYFGGSFALSEPGAGSDAASLRTRANRQGDTYILNGQKMWISTGDQAGVFVVWARTGAEGPKGISCFLVEHDAPGLSTGKPEEKMGLRASHTVSLSLQDVEVPESNLMGQLGQGFAIAMAALDGGRIGIGAQAAGIGWRGLELALA
ncbi:MAG TPA: acyl-CoA dehydrogenase family protein, partial [Myxococcota bacterium]|nr:acyl-CoA dehydrogenase family protein [Myxococcota bacterium]